MRSLLFTRVVRILSPFPDYCVIERYMFALAGLVLAIATRAALDAFLGNSTFYFTVYIFVAFTSLVSGVLPAIVTAIGGFLGVFYWFVSPRNSFVVAHNFEEQGIVGFIAVCSVLIVLGGANRRKQLRLNGTVLALRIEADERRKTQRQLQRAHDDLECEVKKRTQELLEALAKLRSEVTVRRSAETQLRRLSIGLMSAQDEERRRIARDLHDSSGQMLAAIKMGIVSLENQMANLPDLKENARELNGLVDEVSKELRTTSYLLHPPLLDEAGIISAAKWFTDGFAKRSGIQVTCFLPESIEALPRGYELVIFRVLQEALTNVHRHSDASAATVALTIDDQQITLSVSDDGHGINASKLAKLRAAEGIAGVGIAGMRERVSELGGVFTIESKPGNTTVSALLPINKACNEIETVKVGDSSA